MELCGLYTVHRQEHSADSFSYPVHIHDSHEILMVTRGCCGIVIGDTEYELEENEFGVSKLYFNVTPMFNYLSKIFPSNEKKVKVGDVVDELDIEMGSRVVVKLDKKKKKGHYRFTLLDVQPVSDTLDFSSNEQYFPEDGEENTIIFYFGHSQWTSGKSCEVLMMKSFCKENLSYDTFICGFGDDEFVTTSNNGILTKVRGTEIWNDPLQAVRVGNFRQRAGRVAVCSRAPVYEQYFHIVPFLV